MDGFGVNQEFAEPIRIMDAESSAAPSRPNESLSQLPEPLEKNWRLAIEVWPFLAWHNQQK
jgi:hypothetical protein